MAHELPKSYEPGAIEARWAEYWIREKLFHVETPPADPQGLKPQSNVGSGGTAEAVPSHLGGQECPPHTGPLQTGPSHTTRPVFTLLLPPPNVTGRLHMGHTLNQTQMDILVPW